MRNRKAVLFLLVLTTLFASVIQAVEIQQPVLNPVRIAPSVNRLNRLQTALKKLKLSPAEITKMTEQFKALPVEAQDIALASVDSTYAVQAGYKPNVSIDINKRLDLSGPYIESFYPETGQTWSWSYLTGRNFTADSWVYINGKSTATKPWSNGLMFAIGNDVTTGVEHSIYVLNRDTNKQTPTLPYRIIANKGYRGVHGWKFPNFCTSTISWNIYRDYFTPAAVEYSNGTHRPSAQYWYDYRYKTIAGGGDCFGMSVRSIRTRLKDWRGISSSWWPNNVKNCVYDYNECEQIKDCIREDQAGQLCLQVSDIIHSRYDQRKNVNYWSDAIKNAIDANDPQLQPIVCMYKSGFFGHAVVAWQVFDYGTNRYIHFYNNNNPYREDEPPVNDYATINRSSNSMSYNGYNELFMLTFAEATPALPLLPPGAASSTTGSTGSNETVVVVEVGSEVKQITDENGRTFYAGTQENQNEATRIPGSMRFIPLCASSTPVPLPPDFPGIYIFKNSAGKSLKFDLARTAPRGVAVFNAGRVMRVIGGSGSLKLSNLLKPEQALEIAEPARMGVQEINVVSAELDGTEKVFKLENAATIQQNLSVGLTAGTAGLAVSNGAGTEAEVGFSVQRFSNAGIQSVPVTRLKIPANQKGLITPNFSNLQQAPRIDLRAR